MIEFSETITAELVEMLTKESEEAVEHIESLPEGSQPLWYRNRGGKSS